MQQKYSTLCTHQFLKPGVIRKKQYFVCYFKASRLLQACHSLYNFLSERLHFQGLEMKSWGYIAWRLAKDVFGLNILFMSFEQTLNQELFKATDLSSLVSWNKVLQELSASHKKYTCITKHRICHKLLCNYVKMLLAFSDNH